MVMMASEKKAAKIIWAFPKDVILVLLITLGEGQVMNLAWDEHLYFCLKYIEGDNNYIVVRRDESFGARTTSFHWYGYVWGHSDQALHVDLYDHSIVLAAAADKASYVSRDFIPDLLDDLIKG